MDNNQGLKTTESYRISQILKRKILKKHIILTNVNFWLKIVMLFLVAASMIFFAVVSSKVLFDDPEVKHAVGIGKLVFAWPVITSGIVFVGELILLFFIHEKRRWITINFSNNGFGNVNALNKLTKWSTLGYSISLIFMICMFGSWFGFISGAYGNYDLVFNPNFPYHAPIFRDFKEIFISLYSVMIIVEVALIGTLVGIYFYNVKYKETLEEIIPYASKEMSRANSI